MSDGFNSDCRSIRQQTSSSRIARPVSRYSVPPGPVKPSSALARLAKCFDRASLALLNSGQYAEAAAQFAEVASRAPPRSVSRVRAYRNRGFCLQRLAGSQTGMDRERTLDSAVADLREALAMIETGNIVDDSRKAGGLFRIEIGVKSD